MPVLISWIRGSARRRPGAWAKNLADVIADLTALNGETEADFLHVGSKLAEFVSAADRIRAMVNEFAGSLAGEAGESAGAALGQVLSRSVAMQAEIGRVAGRLGALRRNAETIRRAFESVSAVALSFHVAASLGRIETARLGAAAADLSHLGEEVRGCAGSIRDRARHAAEVSANLRSTIDTAVSRISELSSAEMAALPSLAGTAEEHLDQLRARRGQARLGAARLADRFEALSGAVGAIVTALQFQDITRQQLEHIIAALQVMDPHLVTPSRQDTAVLDLQCRQLAAAAATFTASVDRVRAELDRISQLAGQIAAEARALTGSPKDERENFFGQFERCFAAVLSSVSHCGVMEAEIAAIASELRRTVATLEEGAAEVDQVGRGIHSLAINTMIQAVHLGRAGEPLAVVAAAMQALQSETNGPAAEAAVALGEMNGVISALREGTGAACGEAFVGGLVAQVADLHASGEQVEASLERVAKATAMLCAEVESASAAFSVGTRFAEVGRRAGQALRRIVEEHAGPAPCPAAALEELSTRYTMQSERAIHRNSVAEPPVAGVSAGGLQEGEIELF